MQQAKLLSYFAIISFSLGFRSDNPIKEKVLWLHNNIQNVVSVDYSVADFSDLEYLKSKIGNASIVMLGEDRHGDSTTAEAKMRVINYLSTNLGFKILLIERGIYNTSKAVSQLNSTKTSLQILQNTQHEKLYETDLRFWDFTRKKMQQDSFFHVAGIDFFYNSIYIDDLRNVIETIDSNAIHTDEWKYFSLYYLNYSTTYDNDRKKGSAQFFSSANFIITLLKKSQKNQNTSWWIMTVENVIYGINWTNNIWNSKNNNFFERNKDRDKTLSEMAEWYMNYFKGEKVIISMSSYHVSRNLKSSLGVLNRETKKLKPMAEYLYKKHPEKIYSIAFISYSGITTDSNGDDFVISPKNEKSIETLIHKTGIQFGLLDLKSVDSKNPESKWLKNPFLMSPTFSKAYNGNWSNVYDCIFYIDKMSSNNRKPIKEYK